MAQSKKKPTPKPAPRKIGRPTKLTEETMLELEKRFRDGATTLEAIDGVISEDSYYVFRNKSPEFAERMDLAREYVTEIARGVVARAIRRGDRDSAKWWLERKNKAEFSTRQEVTGKDGEALVPKPILGGVTKDGDVPSNHSDSQAPEAE